MKKTLLLLLSIYFVIAGCSNEESNVEVFVTTSSLPVIPATASSCLARLTASGEPPAQDIGASYFRIPVINFGRRDFSKDFIVSLIKITMQIPNSTTPYVCSYGGDQLSALSTEWAKDAATLGESIIPAGREKFSTSCALYCGDLNLTNSVVASGILEIFGLERDSKGEETPVKIQTSLTIQSL